MRIEYRIVSSITNGINETYTNLKDYKERFYYIFNHKEEFKNNSMIYFYRHTYNEEGKYTSKTLSVIDLREEK